MKKFKTLSIFLVAALALSACGTAATPNPTETLAAIYTAAAVTMTAQAAMATATALPLPTDTNTPEPTNTVAATNTQASNLLPISNPVAAGDLSAYMSDVTIPDGSVMQAGKAFTKTWQVFNKGTTTWSTSYKLAFVSGEAMGGTTTAITSEVKPGGTVNVSVNLTAPTSSGTKKGFWRMQNAAGAFFGDQLSVEVVVGGPTATAGTGTPGTATAGPSPTASVTKTPLPASVEIPWNEGDTCDSIAGTYSIDVELLWRLNKDLGYDQETFCQKLGKGKFTSVQVPE